ncbi:MGMT family protein [Gloeopeniophorella convolvens]|nr:MGMT family protein [Gloeopeniophorella convolvens]
MTLDYAEFHAAVYAVVRQIPQGRITTYGHVAKLVGMPAYARHVGQALKLLSPDAAPPVPWQRVVAAPGRIAARGPGSDGAARQRAALEAEGVDVREGRAGEMLVDLGECGWFPEPGTVAFEEAA